MGFHGKERADSCPSLCARTATWLQEFGYLAVLPVDKKLEVLRGFGGKWHDPHRQMIRKMFSKDALKQIVEQGYSRSCVHIQNAFVDLVVPMLFVIAHRVYRTQSSSFFVGELDTRSLLRLTDRRFEAYRAPGHLIEHRYTLLIERRFEQHLERVLHMQQHGCGACIIVESVESANAVAQRKDRLALEDPGTAAQLHCARVP